MHKIQLLNREEDRRSKFSEFEERAKRMEVSDVAKAHSVDMESDSSYLSREYTKICSFRLLLMATILKM